MTAKSVTNPKKTPDKPWTRKEEQLAIQLRQAKHTIASVARLLKRTYGSVSVKLSLLGATKPQRSRRKRGEFSRLVEKLHAQGNSDVRIAQILSSTHQEVWRTRKRLGLPATLTASESGKRGALVSHTFNMRKPKCWACGRTAPYQRHSKCRGWLFRLFRVNGYEVRGARWESYCNVCVAEYGIPEEREQRKGRIP